jgi:SNF2 family DNA or RNA helicase
MVDVALTTTDIRQSLLETYRKLTPLEQTMLQLFSVIYEPISRASFMMCLNLARVTDAKGRAFTNAALKPYIDRFIELGLLVQSGGQGPQCNPLLVEIATRDAIKAEKFEPFVKVVQEKLPVSTRWKDGPRYFSSEGQLMREVRISIYRKDIKSINQQLEDYYKYGYQQDKISLVEIYQLVCNNPFDATWFSTLPKEMHYTAIASILTKSIAELIPAGAAFEFLQHECANQPDTPDVLRLLLIEQFIFRGRLTDAQQILDQLSDTHRRMVGDLQGWILFLKGENEQAIACYTDALQALKKNASKPKVYFQSISGLFFILALLKQGEYEQLQDARSYANAGQQSKHWLKWLYNLLEMVVQIQQGELTKKEALFNAVPRIDYHSIEVLLRVLCLYWVDSDRAKPLITNVLEHLYDDANAAGYCLLAMESAELLTRIKPPKLYSKQAIALRQGTGIQPLADVIRFQAPWELTLKALTHLYEDTPANANSTATQRLVWLITHFPSGTLLQPREQSITAKGDWSKGRPIALKRLKNNPGEFKYLTPQDLEVCSHIKIINVGYYGQTEYMFGERAIAALVGHPLVFWEESPNIRVEIVKGEPELLVTKGKSDQLTIQFSPKLAEKKDIVVVKESPTRLKVIEITAEHRRIADLLGKSNRLEVPVAAKERVLAAINAVSRIVTVQSDIGGGTTTADVVPADPKPHIHLLPVGTGLKVAVLARPFQTGGSYYRPGMGGETVIAEIDGKRLQTTRDLRLEKQLAQDAIDACPTLANEESDGGEWLIDDPESCLELLLELHALDDTVVMEWPEGEKLRVSHHAGLQNFKLNIKRQNDWFETDGELKLDNQTVLDMKQLMQLLDQTPSRFIPIGKGQFLALTQEFRKRLDELRTFSDASGKGLRIHPLAALTLEDWIDEVGDLKADKHWKEHIQRIKDIQTLDPALPSTLQADLRDYQLEGFRWLARLAHWGVGACLADDMGLGKTLQSLALILTRAPQGPTLIVAPTSVGMNWISEAQRFAPTLNVLQFGNGASEALRRNRQKLLDNLQPFDMLVCTYGLLQQEEVADMLSKVQWETIVLDEAQSIKNFATKRSQAAMNLQGGFKLLTTGTPIENHLGELWNLFRFINPGLLGSLESFNERFAIPIERYGDKAARHRLRTLIQPFLLRRTKNQVLQELPSRTEILLHVNLSREEMAFYEALRRDAIVKLSESDAVAGAKHLQVLAEIMKLRRACCNPQLVQPEMKLPSSKLQLFGEVLEELLDNHHKALVFSQFVDHLHLIQDYLDQQQIRYQYLDGSTLAKERKKRVDAFQAGDGDVFLISLKAGGTGLNLTAADYVIHMDPWWNPAVEDQASDRAHRIGQQRPVTIYRLVAKNTIEEKIVDLHQHKRDLADSLLEGSDMSGKISTDELLRLIQEG